MSINKLLSRLKGLESEIKEAISEVESLKKIIVGEEYDIETDTTYNSAAWQAEKERLNAAEVRWNRVKEWMDKEKTEGEKGSATRQVGEEFASQADSATIKKEVEDLKGYKNKLVGISLAMGVFIAIIWEFIKELFKK